MKRLALTFVVLLMGIMSIQAQCSRCGGEGVIRETCLPCHGEGTWTCESCRGSGTQQCYTCHGSGQLTCSYCDGTGKRGDDVCYNCQGNPSFRCELCRGTGEITCRECDGKRYKQFYHCGGSGTKVWRCPECIAAGRI